MKRLLIAIAIFLGVVFVTPYVLLKYTTAPLHVAAWFLEKRGVVMKDFTGNLTEGFMIGTIIASNPNSDLEFHKIRFIYPGISAMRGNDRVVIDEISMDGVKV